MGKKSGIVCTDPFSSFLFVRYLDVFHRFPLLLLAAVHMRFVHTHALLSRFGLRLLLASFEFLGFSCCDSSPALQ